MRDITDKRFPEEFRNVGVKPFTIQAYETAPELIALTPAGSSRAYPAHVEVRSLGKHASSFTAYFSYVETPELYIAELQNPLLYNTVAFSRTGDFFLDSCRMYDPGPRHLNFGLASKMNPYNLGNEYFTHSRMPGLADCAKYDCLALPFVTYSHYGHFLLESIPQLWVLEYGFRPRLVLPKIVGAVPEFLARMLQPFGLDESDCLICSEMSIFERLLLPRRAYMQGRYIADEAKGVFRKIGEYYANCSRHTPEKIFLSRRNIAGRQLENEEHCQEIFERYGFTTIAPETLSFAEQVSIFSKAKYVAGAAGSALHNVLFSLNPDALSVLHIAPEGFVSCGAFCNIERSYNRKVNFIFGKYTVPHTKFNSSKLPWAVDIEDIELGIQQWLDS